MTLADTADARYHALRDALSLYGVVLDAGWYRERAGLPILDLLAQLPRRCPPSASEPPAHGG